jgi:hypothetical protein
VLIQRIRDLGQPRPVLDLFHDAKLGAWFLRCESNSVTASAISAAAGADLIVTVNEGGVRPRMAVGSSTAWDEICVLAILGFRIGHSINHLSRNNVKPES